MSLIVLINSDKELKSCIEESFIKEKNQGLSIQMIASRKQILEALNFDLPDLVILNCNDPKICVQEVTSLVKRDSWLHSFGIIGLYDSEKQDEEELMDLLKDLNLLVLLDIYRIRSHLVKCVGIILKNLQLIFHRDISSHLVERSSGSFVIENDTLAVPIYAGLAVTNMVQRSFLRMENKMALQLVLSELIINGIEHGNCGISYNEKTASMAKGLSVVDLVLEKCRNPAVRNKKIYFEWESDADRTTFVIRDEGEGFNVAEVEKKINTEDPLAQHGRGIRLAKMLSDSLCFNDKGNQVTITVKNDKAASMDTPEGFSREIALYPQIGDVIFKEGQRGNFLYYISRGSFGVFHRGMRVGTLSPVDIFMGEMSFLLNNRRSATVITEEPGKLIKISRKSFIQVLKNYPHYGIFLSKLLARKIVRSNELQVGKLSVG